MSKFWIFYIVKQCNVLKYFFNLLVYISLCRVQNVQCVVLVSWFYVRRSRTIIDQASKQQTPTYFLRLRESHLGVNLWDYNTLRCVRLRGVWPDLQYELAFFLFLVHFNSWAFASSEISSTVTLHYTALLHVDLDIVPSRFSLQI